MSENGGTGLVDQPHQTAILWLWPLLDFCYAWCLSARNYTIVVKVLACWSWYRHCSLAKLFIVLYTQLLLCSLIRLQGLYQLLLLLSLLVTSFVAS